MDLIYFLLIIFRETIFWLQVFVCLNVNAKLLKDLLLLGFFKLHVIEVNLFLGLIVVHFLELWLALLSLNFSTASLAATALALGNAYWPIGATRRAKLSTSVDLTILFDSIFFLLSLKLELLFDFHCNFINIFDTSISRFLSLVFAHFLIQMLCLRSS